MQSAAKKTTSYLVSSTSGSPECRGLSCGDRPYGGEGAALAGVSTSVGRVPERELLRAVRKSLSGEPASSTSSLSDKLARAVSTLASSKFSEASRLSALHKSGMAPDSTGQQPRALQLRSGPV